MLLILRLFYLFVKSFRAYLILQKLQDDSDRTSRNCHQTRTVCARGHGLRGCSLHADGNTDARVLLRLCMYLS